MNLYVRFVSKSAIRRPFRYSVGIILISNVFRNGRKIYVPFVDIISSHPLSNSVNNVTSVKDCGYVLSVVQDCAVESVMISWVRIHTYTFTIKPHLIVSQCNFKLNFYLTREFQHFCIRSSTKISFRIEIRNKKWCNKLTYRKITKRIKYLIRFNSMNFRSHNKWNDKEFTFRSR